jgi:lysyl-tRNA synthetase class 2
MPGGLAMSAPVQGVAHAGDTTADGADVVVRRAKVQALREAGTEPFAPLPERPHARVATVKDAAMETEHRVLGRILSRRHHGRITFLDVRDGSGSLELCAKRDVLGTRYPSVLAFDVGDIVDVQGSLTTASDGEPVLVLGGAELVCKALRPPPGTPGRGRVDVNSDRALSLLAQDRAREMVRLRSRVMSTLREYLDQQDFLEVDTPILQGLEGGARARPFTTKANALGRELSLRISAQMDLRRCIAGGLERVYDLGRCFRNEGVSRRHSPEFTMLEWSAAYLNYQDAATLTAGMVTAVAERVFGTTHITFDGHAIDLTPPFRRISVRDALLEETGVDVLIADNATLAGLLGPRVATDVPWAEAVNTLFAERIEPTLIQPTIVYDFPIEGLPLSQRHAGDRRLSETFDIIVGGLEIASGDTEITDPDEQRARFAQQSGTDVLPPREEAFARMLQYGVAPSAGAGLGVDRMLAILTDAETLNEVITFPVG